MEIDALLAVEKPEEKKERKSVQSRNNSVQL